MGEYAKRLSDEANIKIGTCEDMYYLRFDQRDQVAHQSGNVDPNSEDVYALRFRFPWPSEDGTAPGEFADYHKSYGLSRFEGCGAEHAEHGSVQFSAPAGYLLSLPCPEGPAATLPVHRNGFSGAVHLVQQKLLRDGRLVPIMRCGGCGAKWRLENPAEIEALVVAIRAEADRKERDGRHNGTGKNDRRWYDQVADRVLSGAGMALQLVSA